MALIDKEVSSQPDMAVFLCYRQTDGLEAARWLYDRLNGKPVHPSSDKRIIDVYFDQAAPAVSDWTKIHLPFLKRSRAMIFISSPGATRRESKKDWVHLELDWWLKNRRTAPIVLDTTPDGERWLPTQIKHRWPRIQRIFADFDGWSRETCESEALTRITEGLRLSETNVLFEEYARQRRASRKYVIWLTVMVLAVVAVVALAFALHAYNRVSEVNTKLDLTLAESARWQNDTSKRITKLELLIPAAYPSTKLIVYNQLSFRQSIFVNGDEWKLPPNHVSELDVASGPVEIVFPDGEGERVRYDFKDFTNVDGGYTLRIRIIGS